MKLLFTGASGFIGRNIYPILIKTYEVTTIGLAKEDDIYVNLIKDIPDLKHSYDIVLHAAGKAHFIPKTKSDEKIFFDVNLEGTKNLCRALEIVGVPKSLIFVSTVAVYGVEEGENINENTPLRGNSPYAISKIMAEEFLLEWCKRNNVLLSIIRPSLIAGINPPGNLGAMIEGIRKGRYFSIGGGKARKSVLMVHDIANLLPQLSQKGGIYNLCDSINPSFKDLEALISSQLGTKAPFSIPLLFAVLFARIGDLFGDKAPINSLKLKKIIRPLTFSNEKAKKEFNWTPLNVLDSFKIE